MATTEAGTKGLGMFMRDLAAYFYAKNVIVALTQLKSLQQAFNVLTGLFNWVGLRMNTQKKTRMA